MGPDSGLRVLGSLKKKKTKTARTSPFGGSVRAVFVRFRLRQLANGLRGYFIFSWFPRG
jgi:hypothetical protein